LHVFFERNIVGAHQTAKVGDKVFLIEIFPDTPGCGQSTTSIESRELHRYRKRIPDYSSSPTSPASRAAMAGSVCWI